MRIAVTGWYGHGSIGDELLMCAVARSVATGIDGAKVLVFSNTPATAERTSGFPALLSFVPDHRFLSLRSMAKFARFAITTRGRPLAVLPRLHAVVIGGGALLSDRHRGNLDMWRRQVQLYKAAGAAVYFYGVSIGPLRDAASLHTIRDILQRADGCAVRDQPSLELVRSLVPPDRLIQSADPVLGLLAPCRRLVTAWPPARTLRIGFNVRGISSVPQGAVERAGRSLVLTLLEHLDATLHFLPMNIRDVPLAEAIHGQLPPEAAARVVLRPYRWERIEEHLQEYDDLDMFISMRLHSAIVAALRGLPVVGLDCNPKIPGFLGELGLGAFVSPVSNGIQGYDIDAVDVVNKTRRLIAEWPARAADVIRRLSELRERERKSLDGLRAIIGGASVVRRPA